MSKRRVLVCGASGFIGRNVAERLSARDDLEVFGTYCATTPTGTLAANPRLTLIRADLADRAEVHRVLAGVDVVIQAAAVTTGAKDVVTRPYVHVTDNAVMNSLIFRACFEHTVQHVVFFSCTTMYPSQDQPVKESDFTGQIIDKYFGVGWTKVYIEKLCEFYSRIGPTKYTAIRHSNIYGPYDKYDLERSHVFGATVTKVMTARDRARGAREPRAESRDDGTITVWGDGSEARDLLYVSDLVRFVETVIDQQQVPFELINVGCGQAMSVKTLVEAIMAASGRPLRIVFDTTKPTIPFSLALNIDKARERYGWRPSVSLEEGIRKTLAWYREHIVAELPAASAQPVGTG